MYANATESDPFATAAALDALIFARAHGVARRRRGRRARRRASWRRRSRIPGASSGARDALCKAQLRFEALWALAAAGRPRTDFLADDRRAIE